MLAVKIITPTGLYLEGECEAIHATTVEGEMTLLPSHMPVVAMLATSKLSLKRDGDYKHYAVAGGMLHLHRDQVNILTDAIEGEKEIDLKRAEAARKKIPQPISGERRLRWKKRSTVSVLPITNEKSILPYQCVQSAFAYGGAILRQYL